MMYFLEIWRQIVPCFKYLSGILLCFGIYFLIQAPFRRLYNKLLNFVYARMVVNPTSLDFLVFYFFCLSLGVFFGCCVALTEVGIMILNLGTLLFLMSNMFVAMSILFTQLITCLWLLALGKTAVINLVFCLFEIVELIIINKLKKIARSAEFLIDVKFGSSLVFSALITYFIMNVTYAKIQKNSALSLTKSIPIFATASNHLWNRAYNVLHTTFDQVHVSNFTDFLFLQRELLSTIFIKNCILTFMFCRFVMMFGEGIFKQTPKRFYYIGLIISVFGFSVFFFLKYFILSMILFNVLCCFLMVFAIYGFELLILNDSFFPLMLLAGINCNWMGYFGLLSLVGVLHPLLNFF